MDIVKFVERVQKGLENPHLFVDFAREPRPLVAGGVTVNRLGLQVLRTVGDHVAWSLRSDRPSPEIQSAVTDLGRDGVVVIPNFLDANVFSTVLAEVQASINRGPDSGTWTRAVFGENYVSDFEVATWHPDQFPATCAAFRDSDFIANVASTVSRRPRTYKPHVTVQVVRRVEWNLPHEDLDYNQFVHADRHYPFIKAFFYVEDVDAVDAPYSYARGSHRITRERLAHEYEYSVAHAKARSRHLPGTKYQLMKESRLHALNERYLERIGCPLEPIVGKANTLIISNNQGYHARAPLSGNRRRLTINLDFKFLESFTTQALYPVLKHLYREN